jgi:hypothetical protein
MLYAERKIVIFAPFRLLRSTLFHKIFFLKFALSTHHFCTMHFAPKKCCATLPLGSTPKVHLWYRFQAVVFVKLTKLQIGKIKNLL